MSVFDNLDKSYRPIIALRPCSICGNQIPFYGKTITVAHDAPLVGKDVSDLTLCHGHAIRADEHR